MWIFQGDADDVVQGKLPYRDTLIEYPPYAIGIFLLPHWLGNGDYKSAFMVLVILCDWSLRGLLLLLGWRQTKSLRGLLPLLCYSVGAPFLRFFFLQRFDIWPALICLLALWLFCIGKTGWSGLAIAIGIGVKVYPAVFVPPLFFMAMRQGKGRSFAQGVTAGLLPILLLSFVMPWWRFVQFQGGRGLQCESLWASLIWFTKHLGLTTAHWRFVKRWIEVQGHLATVTLPWARGIFIGAVLCSVIMASLAVWRCREPGIAQVARLLLLPLLAFVAFNTTLSPQFMIWLLPFAAVALLEGSPWVVAGIPVATLLTPVVFPSILGDYITGPKRTGDDRFGRA